ncbi:MAG: NfeD family protein [Ruminococcus sp.]|uniref:NfeD family protein n=1 Tax=Ruminococcus sp. TaxID=41978 RepID=UPI002873E227|nr:NfeD family protein [Ruminococcus sp.]MBQ3284533.1 NfeD family protein [Ruminococcus sp.]
MNTMTIIWLVLAVAMALLEAITVQLVSIWFTIGGIAACITSLFTDNIIIQGAVFVVVSAISLAVTRPLVKKLRKNKAEATNADRYIGKTAIVLTGIDNDKAQGMVKVDTEKWTARSVNGEVIPEGESVTVTAIEGVKLMVSKNNH